MVGIAPKDVGQYLDGLRKENLAVATRKLHLAALRHFFDGMVTRHAILLNPALSVRGDRYEVVEGKTKVTFDIHIIRVYASGVDKPKHNYIMSKRINIVLPDTTVAVLDRVSKKGDRSRFIDRAVRHYVQIQGKQRLRAQLVAGYRANAERDLALAAEWFPLEEEAWELAEASRKTKKPAKTKRT